ncbi:MAG: sensor histidine kinase [Acidimicrobiia bacterium]|nr:sensor histidine kinase [Acidimicrobiia bacterium]
MLARQHRLRVAVIGAAASVGAQLVRGAWRPLAGVGFGWWTVVVVAGYAAVVGWGAWTQAHRALVESLEERARHAEDEQAARVEEARRAERARMAREMHDVLAHRLSLLATVAGALEYHPDAPAAELTRAADVIRSTAHLALEDLREVIGVLRADPAGDANLPGAGLDRPQPTLSELAALVEDWRRTGVVIDLDDALAVEDRSNVSAGLGRTVYRVVQEALTNANKHAPGEAIRIVLQGRPGASLTVTVVNRMPDRDEPVVPGSGAGLVGLAERVDLAGGAFEAGPMCTQEHRVFASLPWRA